MADQQGPVSTPLAPEHGFNWVFLVELLICAILTVFFLFYFNRLFATLISYGIRAYTWHAYHAYIDIQALQFSFLAGRIFFKDFRYHAHNVTVLVHGGYITWNFWHRRVREADVFSDCASEKAKQKRPKSSRHQSSTSESSSPETSGRSSRSRSVGNEEKAGKGSQEAANKGLPYRITLKVSGVEAFLYNRSPAYDAVVENMMRNMDGTDGEIDLSRIFQSKEDGCRPAEDSDNSNAAENSPKRSKAVGSSIAQSIKSQLSSLKLTPSRKKGRPEEPRKGGLPAFLHLLPIYLACNKGAVAVGNESTKAVITAKFDSASGEVNAGTAGPLDIFKLMFRFNVVHPVVQMKPNPDFKALQLATAERLKLEAQGTQPGDTEAKRAKLKGVSKPRQPSLLHKLRKIIPHFSKSVDSLTVSSEMHPVQQNQTSFPGQERWQGLTRYLNNTERNEHDEWEGVEYANTSTLVDCKGVDLSFFWDIPGPVVENTEIADDACLENKEDINGAAPPDYGMELAIQGGTVNYGPWADRLRTNFQSYFFPMSYADAVPAKRLALGDYRISTFFKIFITIEEETIVRIPMRESSKDWKWKGKSETVVGNGKSSPKDRVRNRGRRKSIKLRSRSKTTSGTNVRPFAWLDIKVASNSTVSYVMDMVARHDGYKNDLKVDVKSFEISTSVNHGLLWRSGQTSLLADLSNPLRWNGLREWKFDIKNHDLDLFILRDHLFLLTDLVDDWSSGPPPDFFTFTPYKYLLNVDFRNWKMFLNTNDSNIINNPSDLEDNDFIILGGQKLHGDVTVPLDKFRPDQNEVSYDVRGQDLFMELAMPSRNTLSTFVKTKNTAKLGGLLLTGSYNYYITASPANTDTLTFNIHGSNFTFDAYGWFLRHLVKIKENYFGDDLHFKTLEEVQNRPPQDPNQQLAGEAEARSNQKSSGLDVILCISAERGSLSLPANIYSSDTSVFVELPYASADLRFTNYYMDLEVNSTPLSVSLTRRTSNVETPNDLSSGTQLFIDAVTFRGHRLFGLPPTEPAYMCNWDVEVGNVSGECSSELVEKLASGGQNLGFSIDDDENAMRWTPPIIIHDVTFLRLRTGTVHVWVHIANEALLLSTGNVFVDFNDWTGATFSERLKVIVPRLRVACVDAKSASRHRITRAGVRHVVETHAFLQTTLRLSMMRRKLHFTEEREKQQKHILEQDQRTNRVPFLLQPQLHRAESNIMATRAGLDPPSMTYPPIPEPLRDQSGSTISSVQSSYEESGSSQASSSSSYSSSLRGRPRSPRTPKSQSSASISGSIRGSRLAHSGMDLLKPDNVARSKSVSVHPAPSLSSISSAYHTDSDRERDRERERRCLPPSSIAFSSPLSEPYFPLDIIEPDTTEVPKLRVARPLPNDAEDDVVVFNDVSSKSFDENLTHTSFIVNVEDGITSFFTPRAVESVLNIVEALDSKEPEDILDAFQRDVVGTVLGNIRKREGVGNSFELGLKIPAIHVRFLHPFTANLDGMQKTSKDQYDLLVENISVMARFKQPPNTEHLISMHTSVGAVNASVQGRSETGTQPPVIEAHLEDVLLYAVSETAATGNLSFRDLDIAASSKQVDYLLALVQRIASFASNLEKRVTSLQARKRDSLLCLTYRLTEMGSNMPDPPFLSRPSFGLRAGKDHLRNQDSWKIVSRFRYIWDSLTTEQRQSLFKVLTESLECPADAERHVIASWDQWRTWDLAHVHKSIAMRKIFGVLAEGGEEDVKSMAAIPMQASLRAGGIAIVLDPGPKQHEVALQVLNVAFSSTPPKTPSGLMLIETDTPSRTTELLVRPKNVDVCLRWEISELVEDLIDKFSDGLPDFWSKTSEPSTPPKQASTVDTVRHNFQAVVATDTAKITLDSVNLRSISQTRGLKASLVGSDSRSVKQELSLSTLVHADSGTKEIRSRARLLFRAKLEAPDLYISHNSGPNKISAPEEWMIAAASKFISVEVPEDILGLIEVADNVLADEVSYVQRQIRRFSRPGKPKQTTENSKEPFQLPKLSLALLLDGYHVDIAIMESLTYSMAGTVGRISATPNLQHHLTITLDYDLKGQRHVLRSNTQDESYAIAALDLPPVNGYLKLAQGEHRISVDMLTTVERIVFDASAIHGLLTTLSRPEVTNTFDAIKADISTVHSRVERIFSSSPKAIAQKDGNETSRPLVYDIHLVFAGLSILASAPGKTPRSPKPNLAIELNSVQVKAVNTSPKDNSVLPFPEILAQLRRINVSLSLTENGNIRRCGNLTFGATVRCTLRSGEKENAKRDYRIQSHGFEVNIFAETASACVDVLNYLQDRIKDLDLSKEKKYLRRLRPPRRLSSIREDRIPNQRDDTNSDSSALFASAYALEILNVQVSWIVGGSVAPYPGHEIEDLVLSFGRIDLSTRRDNAARLTIEDMQLQMIPSSLDKRQRSPNSALLPEVIFNVAYNSTKEDRKFAFQAAGKSLDIQLTPQFILPASVLEQSISLAGKKFRAASKSWQGTPTPTGAERKNPFGNKKLSSFLIDADFAGAVVNLSDKKQPDNRRLAPISPVHDRVQGKGRYGQFVGDGTNNTTALRAPGVALKVEYQDVSSDPSLNAELKVDASSNTLYPTVVPLILEVSDSIKQVVRVNDKPEEEKEPDNMTESKHSQRFLDEDNILATDPSSFLGKTRLNLGLRVCKQEFSLSCQPIARVAATAGFDDVYITCNSVKSPDLGHFFAISGAFDNLEASVQHVYSRESTFRLGVESIVLSLMNSKHFSGKSGVSAIVKVNPVQTQVNARKLQDFLLFREIWVPPEMREPSQPSAPTTPTENSEFLVQRYHQVAAAAAFPWNATIAITKIAIDLDLGQAIGKSTLAITNLWASSKKNSDWEQNLCIAVESIGVSSGGRMSGFVELERFRVRTSIAWPRQDIGFRQTPLIQASIGFDRLRVKAAFDYQAIGIADISSFDFLMYNVRRQGKPSRDRLVASLEGSAIHAFCSATSAAQAVALFQALERLIQETQTGFAQSVADIERYIHRRASSSRLSSQILPPKPPKSDGSVKAPISLHTDVMVSLRSINVGVYPTSFQDTQIFLLNASDAQARFAVSLERGKIHSGLGMTLGELRIALASIPQSQAPISLGEVKVDDVIRNAASSRGGTILRVPKVVASMQTWQRPAENHIDYIFKSKFEGKVDVGWNYSRISFIRGMWASHSRSLASRLGKPLPESAVKITTGAAADSSGDETGSNVSGSKAGSAAKGKRDRAGSESSDREKITAVVNVPQSRYEYEALEPPVIETPQLRDMGEATPPLEWIGLHRDRLPNVTHQIVIVTLLEVAKEVEDAYSRILGSS
ncbi:hypothetical protein BDY21DRAFT_56378 [Lineolata rhizophorae]|uniref:Fermentation associated protein n=1 Tax=Lineolata rhizophorae TaxID=578093 RepID=A0A6A6NWN4_9PEZI|nr:hypothetical protein BDY21DRAFT_56378 [Lineolata rhizophorae]